MWRWIVAVVLAGGLATDSATAAEREELVRLAAPPPAAVSPLPAGSKVQALKFARAVVRLPAEPWARVAVVSPGPSLSVDYVTWTEERDAVDQAKLAVVFSEEMAAAGVPVPGLSSSVFADEEDADLRLGVAITGMKGRFCRGCGWNTAIGSWVGAVTMRTRWEVYSQLQGKVLATITTEGGFTTPKGGLVGDPERLIYEAFRDNLRRLTANEEFQRAVTSSKEVRPTATAIAFTAPVPAKRTVASSGDAVAAIFAGDGFGSGFLISSEGYLLTNQHVVGGAKYVKVRWADKSETVGEVIRVDRRRDVAIVKVDPGARKPLALSHAPPLVGDNVFVIGTPLDEKLQGTVTKGIVSGTRELEGLSYIQSDAVTNQGNSGGPLLDEGGAVVGIAVMIYAVGGAPTGLNLFIPIGDALKALALRPAA